MFNFKHKFSVIICAVLIVAGATLHGNSTHRWELIVAENKNFESLHSDLLKLPGFSSREIPSDMPIKEKSKVTCREYFSGHTNNSTVVSVTTGIPGAVATHTPDVCYVSSGYKMVKPMKRESVQLADGSNATFYVSIFEKKRATGIERQKVRWAWTADGKWEAPDSPRFRYMQKSNLAKIYIVTSEFDKSTEDNDSLLVQQLTKSIFEQYSATLKQ
jgi:hypothetical protein